MPLEAEPRHVSDRSVYLNSGTHRTLRMTNDTSRPSLVLPTTGMSPTQAASATSPLAARNVSLQSRWLIAAVAGLGAFALRLAPCGGRLSWEPLRR